MLCEKYIILQINIIKIKFIKKEFELHKVIVHIEFYLTINRVHKIHLWKGLSL